MKKEAMKGRLGGEDGVRETPPRRSKENRKSGVRVAPPPMKKAMGVREAPPPWKEEATAKETKEEKDRRR